MIKVLIIHSTTHGGGLTRIMYNICKVLAVSEVEYHLLLLSPQLPTHTDVLFKEAGVNIIQAPSGLGFLGSIKFIEDTIQKLTPQLIHTHGLRGNVFGSLCAGNLPHVSTLHGNMLHNYTTDFGLLRGVVASLIHMLAFAGASVQTLVSPTLKSTPFISSEAIVIPNGIDTQLFQPLSQVQKMELRKILFIPQDAFVFIYAGSLNARKSVNTLLHAFQKVAPINTQAHLYILGIGDSEDNLKTIAAKHSQIFFKGHVAEVNPWLQAADVFISPSLSEGMPNAPLEALGCGLDLILSDIPPHREVAKITGASIDFFEPKNSAQLANLLTDCLNHKAKKHAVETISMQQMAAQYLQVYKEVCMLT